MPARALAQTSPAETARATTARARVYGAAVTAKSVAKEGEMATRTSRKIPFAGMLPTVTAGERGRGQDTLYSPIRPKQV